MAPRTKRSRLGEHQLLHDLNPEQRRAVTHARGPQLIVAGAGTGKTTVITKRIAWLVLDQGVSPDHLLALTFTEKAATEMEERVDRLLPYGYVDLWISTFHSFCEKILKRHALDIGLANDFALIDSTAAWLLMRQHLDRFNLDYYRPRGNPTKFLHALHQHFSRCKDEAVTPAAYLAYAKELRLNADGEQGGRSARELVDPIEIARIEEIANAYHVYQQLLLEQGVLDFGDLLVDVLRLFRERPAILAQYQQQFDFVLVDEFQDTNWAQYEIVKLLVEPQRNLTVVADDDQSIYIWRGASMSNILHFKEDYPEAAEVAITTSYRAKQNLLDASYRLIQHNNPNRLEATLRISKALSAAGEGTGVLEVFHARDAGEEARFVAERIRTLHGASEDGAPSWNDFAILIRANKHAEQFMPALVADGIPYQFLASRGLYRKPIILDLLAYLKLLDDYHESPAFYRVLSMDAWGFSYDELLTLTSWAQRKAKSLYQVLQGVRAVPHVTPEMVQKVERILRTVTAHTDLARRAPVREVVLAFLEDSGVLQQITKEESAADHATVGVLNQFWKKIEAFEEAVDEPSVKRFMALLDLEREAGEEGSLPTDPSEGPEAVKLLTVHASKGLEFRYVFIVNAIEQRFPAVSRRDPIELPLALTKEIVPEGDAHLEEERRLFYVACTRAKDGVFVSYADDYGGTRTRKPSRFLAELGIDGGLERAKAGEQERGKRAPALQRSSASALQPSVPLPPAHALPSKLSFTQLRAYQTCPWQYHYAHILRIPLRGRYVLSFGQTMHNTLQRFFNDVAQRASAEQSDLFAGVSAKRKAQSAKPRVPTLEELLRMYEGAWIDDWYESRAQMEEYRANGKRILKEFYAKHEADGWPTVYGTEQAFTVKFGPTSVMGKADRIDVVPGGVEIIDYKTGSPKDRLTSDDKTQLLIYQIAATQALGLVPKLLSYYYLESNQKVSFLGTEYELDALGKTVEDVSQRIANGDFTPTPGLHCSFCDFRAICPYAQ